MRADRVLWSSFPGTRGFENVPVHRNASSTIWLTSIIPADVGQSRGRLRVPFPTVSVLAEKVSRTPSDASCAEPMGL
jgi:hypothetical protein